MSVICFHHDIYAVLFFSFPHPALTHGLSDTKKMYTKTRNTLTRAHINKIPHHTDMHVRHLKKGIHEKDS